MNTNHAIGAVVLSVVAVLASIMTMVLSVQREEPTLSPPLLKSWTLPSGVVIEQFVPGDSFYCLVASKGERGGLAMVCAGVKPPSSSVEESP